MKVLFIIVFFIVLSSILGCKRQVIQGIKKVATKAKESIKYKKGNKIWDRPGEDDLHTDILKESKENVKKKQVKKIGNPPNSTKIENCEVTNIDIYITFT